MGIGCVVMAAGSSLRFSGNKLLANWEGRPLAAWALDAVPPGLETAVVSQYPEVLAMAEARGFTPVENLCPQAGVSRTIRLGLAALPPCAGVLFLVADQPRLRRETVEALIARWREDPSRIVCPAAGGRRGNPCLFPAALLPELAALEGDVGGSRVIRRHPELVTLVETDPAELEDLDRPWDR